MSVRLLTLALFITTAQAQDAEDPWPEAFTRHLRGTIGEKLDIEMQLQAEPGTELFFNGERQFRGHYWYASKRVPIDLFGSEPDHGKVKLDEQVLSSVEKGWETTGTFDGELNQDGTFSGTWTGKDGKRKLPFKLVSFVPPGAVKMKAHALGSSWSERTAEGVASLEHTALVIQVAADTPAARKINQVLLKHACEYFADTGSDDPDKKETSKPTANDKKAQKSLTLDSVSEALLAERDEELLTNHEKWSFSYVAGVELNVHDILCTSYLLWAYTGGAHGNSNTEFFTFDTRTGAELPLKQMFKPGFLEALPKLATEKLRKQEGSPGNGEPGPTIESLNFEEGDGAWFLSAAGFVVHFDPYAIASYARGNVQLTIPWAELEPWLTADSPLKKFLVKTK
jgi:hypothetical protein